MMRWRYPIIRLAVLLALALPGTAATVTVADGATLVASAGGTVSLAWTVDSRPDAIGASWTANESGLNSWTVTSATDGLSGVITSAIPANYAMDIFHLPTVTLTATWGAVHRSIAKNVMILAPPQLNSGTSTALTISEDVEAVTADFPFTSYVLPLQFTLSGGSDQMAISITSIGNTYGTTARLNLTPEANFSTPTGSPIHLTLRATDACGAIKDVPLTVTVTSVNDPPVIRLSNGAFDPMPYDPHLGSLVAIDPVVDGIPAFAPHEEVDPDFTHVQAGTTSTFLRWRLYVDNGVDGGDLLKPVGDGVTWQVRDGNIQRNITGTWTTVATWNRTNIDIPSTTRSDTVMITLTTNAVCNATRDDVTGVLQLVQYAWLQPASYLIPDASNRSIKIILDEPRNATANLWDHATFYRTIIFSTPNHPPLIASALAISAIPLVDTPFQLAVVDDGRPPGCASAAEVRLSLTANGSPRGGFLFHTDHPGVPLQPGTTFTVAEMQAGKIGYHHTETSVTTDTVGLMVSDGDQSITIAVAISIAMDHARLGILSDPPLTLRRPAVGSASSLPLRFTHPVSTTEADKPKLHAYPGLAAPAGVNLSGDNDAGWRIGFDWTAIPVGTPYIAFVVTAHTDAASATSARDVSQAMLIRLLPAAAAAPSGNN